MLGDAVSLWRAYAIYGRPKWLYALFHAMILVESSKLCMSDSPFPGSLTRLVTVASAFFCASLSVDYLPLSQDSLSYIFLVKTKTYWFLLAYLVTDLSQLTATLLIAYKAWCDIYDLVHRLS